MTRNGFRASSREWRSNAHFLRTAASACGVSRRAQTAKTDVDTALPQTVTGGVMPASNGRVRAARLNAYNADMTGE